MAFIRTPEEMAQEIDLAMRQYALSAAIQKAGGNGDPAYVVKTAETFLAFLRGTGQRGVKPKKRR